MALSATTIVPTINHFLKQLLLLTFTIYYIFLNIFMVKVLLPSHNQHRTKLFTPYSCLLLHFRPNFVDHYNLSCISFGTLSLYYILAHIVYYVCTLNYLSTYRLLSPHVIMHGGLLWVAFCLSVCLWLDQNYWTIIHISRSKVTLARSNEGPKERQLGSHQRQVASLH